MVFLQRPISLTLLLLIGVRVTVAALLKLRRKYAYAD
jgi:hypothetical protein